MKHRGHQPIKYGVGKLLYALPEVDKTPATPPVNPPQGSGMPRKRCQDAPGTPLRAPRCLTEAEWRIRLIERATVALMPLMKPDVRADQVAAIVSLAVDGGRP